MNIGVLAKQAQVNIQTVRYYERIGLLLPTHRGASGYRVYDDSSLRRLTFIKRAQGLGFSLRDVADMLALNLKTPAARDRAFAKAKRHAAGIRAQIAGLRQLEATLNQLIHDCEHGARPGPCPILERLSGEKPSRLPR